MILATTKFADWDRFWSVFSTAGAEKRAEHGCKGALVFRDDAAPDSVLGRLRLGRRRLGELRERPVGPAGHEGSGPPHQAVHAPASTARSRREESR